MELIKWHQAAAFGQNIILGNNLFYLDAFWNVRDEAWYLSIKTANGLQIITNIKVTIGIDLLSFCKNEEKPDGELLVVPTNPKVSFITRDNMGVDVNLIFVGANEVL